MVILIWLTWHANFEDVIRAENHWLASAVCIQAIAVIYTVWQFSESKKIANYHEKDRLYFELRKIAIDRPFLQNPPGKENGTSYTPEQKDCYHVYAEMIFTL